MAIPDDSSKGPADHSQAPGFSLAALALVACPACHHRLRLVPSAVECTGCGRLYPVRDGIPVLIVDESQESATR